MARLHAMGKARRKAVPVYWTEREPPPIPTALLNGEKEVGSLKSMFMREEGGIGMAIVHENGIPELDENGLLVRDSKRGRIKRL